MDIFLVHRSIFQYMRNKSKNLPFSATKTGFSSWLFYLFQLLFWIYNPNGRQNEISLRFASHQMHRNRGRKTHQYFLFKHKYFIDFSFDKTNNNVRRSALPDNLVFCVAFVSKTNQKGNKWILQRENPEFIYVFCL